MPYDFPMNTNVAEREKKLGLKDLQRSTRSRKRIPRLDSKEIECDSRMQRLVRHPSASITPVNAKEETKLHRPESNTNVKEVKRPLRERMFKSLLSSTKEKQNTSATENIVKKKLVLEPLRIEESKVPSFLEHYRAKAQAKIIESYSPLKDLLEYSQEGYNPHWLSFKFAEDTTIKGLVVFHLQPNNEAKWQVIILHASTTEELLVELLELSIKYIWENIHCKEIKVVLNYIKYIGNFMVYEPLKKAYQKMKFKGVSHNASLKQAFILDLDKTTLNFLIIPRFLYFMTLQ